MPDSDTEGASDVLFGVMVKSHQVNRTEMKDLLWTRGYRLSDLQFNMVVHRVRERLRTEVRLEFVPDARRDGWLVRATNQQKIRRGQKFAQTGLLKQQRAVRILQTVNQSELTGNRRQIFTSTLEKTQQAATRSHHALVLEERESRPTVCERPSDPRKSK